jgi:hypothetical protein
VHVTTDGVSGRRPVYIPLLPNVLRYRTTFSGHPHVPRPNAGPYNQRKRRDQGTGVGWCYRVSLAGASSVRSIPSDIASGQTRADDETAYPTDPPVGRAGRFDHGGE